MKRIEEVWREILYQSMEQKRTSLTQRAIAEKLGVSLSLVNHSLISLRRMNAIRVNPRNFRVVNPKKLLYYWACIRNIKKDLLYEARIDESIPSIEKNMPDGVVYAAYTAYKFMFKEIPSDYSVAYVYSDDVSEVKKRFPGKGNVPNLRVLKPDWNMDEWYAAEFLKALEKRMSG